MFERMAELQTSSYHPPKFDLGRSSLGRVDHVVLSHLSFAKFATEGVSFLLLIHVYPLVSMML